MSLVQIVTNAAMVGAVGVVLGFLVHGVEARFETFRSELRGDVRDLHEVIGKLRTETREDLTEVRRELGDLRSDLTQVALALGARTGRTG